MNSNLDKTRVDDMLIEMIAPKVHEIEQKFTSNQSLTQEDINTLLLKSQYNHINHLDLKLNQVTEDVSSLKGEFKVFKMEIIAENEKRFNRMENKFEALKADFSEFKADMAGFKADIQTTLNNTMRWYIGTASIIIIVLKALDLLVK